MDEANQPTEVPQRPIERSPDLDDLVELFKLHRDYIKFEHSLQHERTTWHLVIQAFLFAALGVLGEWPLDNSLTFHHGKLAHDLPYILAGVGVLVAVISLISVKGADLALNRLHHHWNQEVRPQPRFIPLLHLLPKISGGGDSNADSQGSVSESDKTARPRLRWDELPKNLGRIELLGIPIIIMVAWIVVFIMLFAGNPQAQQQGPCEVKLSANPTQADLAAATVCSIEATDYYRSKLKDSFQRVIVYNSGADNPPAPAPAALNHHRKSRKK